MKIVLDGVQHPSLNKWPNWHWGKKSKTKKRFEELVANECEIYGKPKLSNAIVEIKYYFDNRHRRDKDNYTPKFIMDGLVKAGIIEDDNDNNVFLNWKLLYDKDNPRTEIYIEEGGK